MVNHSILITAAFQRVRAHLQRRPARAVGWLETSATALTWGAMPVFLAILIQAKQKLPKRSIEEAGTAMITALAGLAILLFALLLLVWLGGHLARRYMDGGGLSLPSIGWSRRQDDWADRPLPDEDDKPDDDP